MKIENCKKEIQYKMVFRYFGIVNRVLGYNFSIFFFFNLFLKDFKMFLKF